MYDHGMTELASTATNTWQLTGAILMVRCMAKKPVLAVKDITFYMYMYQKPEQ